MVTIYKKILPYTEEEKDRFYFESTEKQTVFFNNLDPVILEKYKVTGTSLEKINITLNLKNIIGIDIFKCNFLKVNRLGKDFYYWITDFFSVGSLVVTLSLELDYYNSYYFDFLFELNGNVSVLRNHQNRYKNINGILVPEWGIDQDINNLDSSLLSDSKEIVKIEQYKIAKSLNNNIYNLNQITSDDKTVIGTVQKNYSDAFVYSNAIPDGEGITPLGFSSFVVNQGGQHIYKFDRFGEVIDHKGYLTYFLTTPLSLSKGGKEDYTYIFKSDTDEKTPSGYGVKKYSVEQDVNKSLVNRIANSVNPNVNFEDIGEHRLGFQIDNINGSYVIDSLGTKKFRLNQDLSSFIVFDGERYNLNNKSVVVDLSYIPGWNGFKKYFIFIDWSGDLESIEVEFINISGLIVPNKIINPIYKTRIGNTYDAKIWNDESVGTFNFKKSITLPDYEFLNQKPTIEDLKGEYKFYLEPQISIDVISRDFEYNNNNFNIPLNIFSNFSIWIKQFQGVDYIIDNIEIINSNSNEREILNNINTDFSVSYDNTLPSTTDIFNQYLATSKSQMKNSYLTSSGNLNFDKQLAKQNNALANQKIGASVISATKAGITGGAMGFLAGGPIGAAVGALSGIADKADGIASSVLDRERIKSQGEKSVFNSKQQIRQIESKAIDLYNSPDTLNKGSIDLYEIWESNNIKNSIIESNQNVNNEISLYVKYGAPNLSKLKEITQYTFLNGYISNRFKNLNHNNLLTRSRFVYLQIEKISVGVKANINLNVINYFNELFNNGVRLWNPDSEFKNYFIDNNVEKDLL